MNLIQIDKKVINADHIVEANFTHKDDNNFANYSELHLKLAEYVNVTLVEDEAERVWQALLTKAYAA